ncbi:Rrf2 family transcriptional regulator [Pararobbsia silviterrae]|uniref:Rrf2 family transcriptional regulator n=1 Tax=Pararobbsia silviterrae TaxID=1792498 RepID=A0A494XW18_9BURK|nr:Rrf2 family transcriptional regulator [Pararobbsia silviterrae]RKP54801.1 Rrf2 family transcriptional regulator [Pararobbsia silviterrae]
MRLTDYTDYSLRVLLYLTVRRDRLATIQEIAEAYGVSKNHLMKIAQRLGELGWIETVRGRKGGLRLAPDSTHLTIGRIVRETESDFALAPCFARHGSDAAAGDVEQTCVIAPSCQLKDVFARARDAFLRELDNHTLAQISEPSAALSTLLGMTPIRVIRHTETSVAEAALG